MRGVDHFPSLVQKRLRPSLAKEETNAISAVAEARSRTSARRAAAGAPLAAALVDVPFGLLAVAAYPVLHLLLASYQAFLSFALGQPNPPLALAVLAGNIRIGGRGGGAWTRPALGVPGLTGVTRRRWRRRTGPISLAAARRQRKLSGIGLAAPVALVTPHRAIAQRAGDTGDTWTIVVAAASAE